MVWANEHSAKEALCAVHKFPQILSILTCYQYHEDYDILPKEKGGGEIKRQKKRLSYF